MTEKGNTVYVHVLDWPDPVMAIPAIAQGGEIGRHAEKRPEGRLPNVNGGTLLRLPKAQLDPVDTIVVLER